MSKGVFSDDLSSDKLIYVISQLVGLKLDDELNGVVKGVCRVRSANDYAATDLFTFIHELHHLFNVDLKIYRGELTPEELDILYRWHAVEIMVYIIKAVRNKDGVMIPNDWSICLSDL